MTDSIPEAAETADAGRWPPLGRPADEALMDLPEVPGWDGELLPDDGSWPPTAALRFYQDEVRHWTEYGRHFSDLPDELTQLAAAGRGIYLLTLEHPPDTTLLLFSEDGSFLAVTDDGFECGAAGDLPGLFGALARQVVLLDEMTDDENE